MIAHKVSWRVPEASTPLNISLPARDRILNLAQVEASGPLLHSCSALMANLISPSPLCSTLSFLIWRASFMPMSLLSES